MRFREGEYQVEGEFEGGEEAEEGVREGYGVGDLDGGVVAGGEATDEEAVDGGGAVLEGVEGELYVGGLGELVLAVCYHGCC